jgi:hypothetical protein
MSAKEKRSQEEIERQILRELKEEIIELNKQGKLYKFETALDNAMAKFKKAIEETTEETLEIIKEESDLKKTDVQGAEGK